MEQEALNWWNNILTEAGRSQFPIPKDNGDIIMYYNDPAEFCYSSSFRY
jgi:hypothetical protein